MFIIEVLLWLLGILVGLALLLWLTLFLMLLPGRKSKVKNFKWLFERPIAHRGYHKGNKEVPENSKAAYLAAIEKGYHIEIDVHLTKDNKVVIFHDGDLNRMCGVDKKVFESTYEELLQYPLMGGQEKMMELQEFLDLVNDQVGVLIEFKDDFLDGRLERAAYEILKNYNASEDRELIVLFITDGMPTTDTPNQNIEYELLKEEYPNIQVKGIQYEATSSKINELEYISEEQYIANQENIKDILYVAALNPYPYNSFHVKDFINTTYFDIDKLGINSTNLQAKNHIPCLGKDKGIIGTYETNSKSTKFKECIVTHDKTNPTRGEEGDLFYIYVLDQILAYKVDKISVVDPDDIENLKMEEGQDYVTLVTCTPYAINTHRLLVRGTRITYNEEEFKSIKVNKKLSTSDITLIGGLITVVIIVISSFIIIKKIQIYNKTHPLVKKERKKRLKKKQTDMEIAFPKLKDK